MDKVKEVGIYVDPAEEYEQTAEFSARIYGCVISPKWVKALIGCSDDVEQDILANPHHWTSRVNDYLYEIYMTERGL